MEVNENMAYAEKILTYLKAQNETLQKIEQGITEHPVDEWGVLLIEIACEAGHVNLKLRDISELMRALWDDYKASKVE